MPIVATIVRSSVSRFYSQAERNVGSGGGNNFTLRKADGLQLGTYENVGQAQAAFAQFHGSNRILKWQRSDLRGDIEQWVAIGTPLDPSEIWVLQQPTAQVPNATPAQTSLIHWVEPAVSLGSIKLIDVDTNTIRRVSDLSGANNFWLVDDENNAPVLIDPDNDFNGRPSVALEVDPGAGFNVPNLGSLAPPYTIILVANNSFSSFNGVLAEVDGATTLRFSEDGATGEWQLRVGGAPITSSIVGDTSPAILTATVTSTTTRFRVNGVDAGSLAAAPNAGPFIIGGLASDSWFGRISFAMIADLVDSNDTRILQTERYLRERYQ